MILPAFGIIKSDNFYICVKNIFLVILVCVYAILSIGILGFLVWSTSYVYCRYGCRYKRLILLLLLCIIAIPTGIINI